MTEKLTKKQLESLQDLLNDYNVKSKRFDFSEPKLLAHPNIDNTIYYSIKVKGFKSGELYEDKLITCIYEDGTTKDCFTMFRTQQERENYINSLIEVGFNSKGEIFEK